MMKNGVVYLCELARSNIFRVIEGTFAILYNLVLSFALQESLSRFITLNDRGAHLWLVIVSIFINRVTRSEFKPHGYSPDNATLQPSSATVTTWRGYCER